MTRRIGVLDWGIGGIDALDRLRRARPDLDWVYHSDAGVTPYGRLPHDVLAARLAEVVAELEVELVVVACNAASTVLGEVDLGVPAIGVIAPGLETVLATDHQVLGLIGGERTIASRVWEEPLARAGRRVHARVAQPLSAHVEAGRLSGPELEADLDTILAPLSGVEALILACTHYPAVRGPIAERLPGVVLLDPVDALVERVLEQLPPTSARMGSLRALTSGDPRATRAAAIAAFGVDPGEVTCRRTRSPSSRPPG